MFFRSLVASALAVPLLVCASALSLSAQQPDKKPPATDLDAFMERVLARRDINKRQLNDYILDESEMFEILGPARMRLHRTKRDYTWYVRDGMHVRSPVRFEGVSVGEKERDTYEERWIRREKARRERKAKGEKESREIAINESGIAATVGSNVPTEPRFVSEAYFMDFKFEPGNYLLAGREQLEGQDVLKIEYYPTKLFGDDDEKRKKKDAKDAPEKKDTGESRRERQEEQDIDRKMNKTALVTLWVDPANHQIVKYTFDNVWLDFLPGSWLVQIDEMRASMTMFQPFAGVWLPRDIRIGAGLTLANGSFEAHYERRFSDYREADVKSKVKIPKSPTGPDPAPGPDPQPGPQSGPDPSLTADEVSVRDRGPSVLINDANKELAAQVQKSGPDPSLIVREVRVHGNAAIADAEVLKIAGISLDQPLAADGVAGIERRLKQSGWFESVDVRQRFRSLSDPTDIAIVLVVHEKPSVTASPISGIPMKKPIRLLTRQTMFLPIVSFADGYGFTYGARFSTKDLLGLGERLSVPLTWGGMRRAAIELERNFKSGPLTRVFTSASIYQRENPAFTFDEERGVADRRYELRARAERHFAHTLFTGIEATRAKVEFGPIPDARQWTFGADAALDTRGDPAFPGNAFYLGGGWNRLNVSYDVLPVDSDQGTSAGINRYTLDGRGYLRLFGQPVLAVRGLYTTADAPLPMHERWLLGGSSTLRGFRLGAFHGNETLVTSAELRIPITSVISGAKLGVTIFADAAKAVDYAQKLSDVKWERGAGAGIFIIAPLVKINLDVAKGFNGGTRVHLSSGFAF